MDTSLEYSMHTLVLQTRKTGWVARPLLAKFVPIYPTLNLINQESRPGPRLDGGDHLDARAGDDGGVPPAG